MSPRSAKSNKLRSSAPNTRPLNHNWSGFMKSIAKDNAAYDKISVDVDVMEKECC